MLYIMLIALLNRTIMDSFILKVKVNYQCHYSSNWLAYYTTFRFTLMLDILETKDAKNSV